MQGQLRREPLTFCIATECAHCGRPIHTEMDAALRYSVSEQGATPLIFAPTVDIGRLKEPSIIDAF